MLCISLYTCVCVCVYAMCVCTPVPNKPVLYWSLAIGHEHHPLFHCIDEWTLREQIHLVIVYKRLNCIETIKMKLERLTWRLQTRRLRRRATGGWPRPLTFDPGKLFIKIGRRDQWPQSWALEVFFNFFNKKKWIYCIFYKVNNLYLHQSYLKSPFPVKLTW